MKIRRCILRLLQVVVVASLLLASSSLPAPAAPAQESHSVSLDTIGTPSAAVVDNVHSSSGGGVDGPDIARPAGLRADFPGVLPAWWPATARQESIHRPAAQAQAATTSQGSPVMFIENVGQFAEGARFQVRGGMGTMWLADDGLWVTVMEPVSPTLALSLYEEERGMELPSRRLDSERRLEREDEPRRGVNLKLSFAGANPHPRLEPISRLDTVVSYFIGDDPEQRHAGVPVWGGVRYVDLYPGVDLEVTSGGGHWTWRFEIHNSQFAVSNVRLRVEGAETLTLDDTGHLSLSTAGG